MNPWALVGTMMFGAIVLGIIYTAIGWTGVITAIVSSLIVLGIMARDTE